jgi:hypothetical protein
MHDSYRQEQAVGQINQNRDDLAEILNEIWSWARASSCGVLRAPD